MRTKFAVIVFVFVALFFTFSTRMEAQQAVTSPNWSRLAAIEKSVDQWITADATRAEKLLKQIEEVFSNQEVLPVLPRTMVPRTFALVSRFGGSSVTIKVAGPSHPLVRGGFAAMIVGETLFVRPDVETGLSEESLRVVIAHELSHDRFDAVRKRLWQQVREITPEEISWLDARVEARAHMGAVKKLVAGGYQASSVLAYVKQMHPGLFTTEQLAYVALAVEGAAADSVAVLNAQHPAAQRH
jgi:hypothetical protein